MDASDLDKQISNDMPGTHPKGGHSVSNKNRSKTCGMGTVGEIGGRGTCPKVSQSADWGQKIVDCTLIPPCL